MLVYKITNRINGKIYVGCTKNSLRSRWLAHVCHAKAGKKSFPFYRAINKHTKENFTLEQIDSADSIEEMFEKEIKWIALLNSTDPTVGYNCTPGGEGTVYKPEYSEKLVKMFSKPFSFRSPTGEVVSGINLNGFCKERGLTQNNMHSVMAGKIPSCKGWTSVSFAAFSKIWFFRSPEGKSVLVRNLVQFESESGLSQQQISGLTLGSHLVAKEWSLLETPKEKVDAILNDKRGKIFKVLSPDGEVFSDRGCNKFAKTHGLCGSSFKKLVGGKIKKHKGWTLLSVN